MFVRLHGSEELGLRPSGPVTSQAVGQVSRPESCVVLAGGSPAAVSAGAPRSRVRTSGEIHASERTVKGPQVIESLLGGEQRRGPSIKRTLQPREIGPRKGVVAEPIIPRRRQQTASVRAGGWIGNSIAATQLGGRPWVVSKHVTTSHTDETSRGPDFPPLKAGTPSLGPAVRRYRGARGTVPCAARGARAHTSPSQRLRSLGSPPSMCLLAVGHARSARRRCAPLERIPSSGAGELSQDRVDDVASSTQPSVVPPGTVPSASKLSVLVHSGPPLPFDRQNLHPPTLGVASSARPKWRCRAAP